MKPTEDSPDPLLDRLRGLRRDVLDDVTASRTLARAEVAFASASAARPAPVAPRRQRAAVPLALAAWGAIYLWGVVGELGRLFPTAAHSAGVAASPRVDPLRSPAPRGPFWVVGRGGSPERVR